MKITVTLEQGYLPKVYTREATTKRQQQPIVSFPITVQQLPAGTQALALSLIDYDAVPRTAFPFIHWLAADLPPMSTIPVDFSRQFTGPQGQTSWMSRFYQLNDPYFTAHYAGPNPPDHPHHYTLTVYALSQRTGLTNGFYYNDFLNQLTGRLLDQATLQVLAQ